MRRGPFRTPEYRQLHAQLHKMWSDHVGRPGYNKQDWKELQVLIQEAVDAAAQEAKLQLRRN